MMKTLLVIDSSVFVSAFREVEEKHKECKKLFEMIVEREYISVEPYSVLIEVSAAIKRRTGDKIFAHEVGKGLAEISSIHFFEIVKSRAEKASSIAIEVGLKGMDAIVVQIAEEMGAFLVSLDVEMMEKAKSIVTVKSVMELIL
ncbi:MAG: type II toxin-antitoxin system VapC family toxin [Nitrospirota bacterium]